jgi:hypothetical protein
MRPHNAHVREYYRHIFPVKVLVWLLPPIALFFFLMGILLANTWLAFQCAWPF